MANNNSINISAMTIWNILLYFLLSCQLKGCTEQNISFVSPSVSRSTTSYGILFLCNLNMIKYVHCTATDSLAMKFIASFVHDIKINNEKRTFYYI